MATDVIGELSFGKSFQMLETGEVESYISLNTSENADTAYRRVNTSATCRL